MMNAVVIVCALLAVVQGQNDDAYKPRIVNGEEAKLGEIPYQVSLKLDGDHFCGGSVVNEYWVVTAAHCVERASAADVDVFAGTISLKEPHSSHRAAQIIAHQNYSSHDSYINDIALVKVVTPFVFSSRIQPVSLPESHAKVATNSSVVVSGWGTLQYHGEVPDKLQKATIYILEQSVCKAAMEGTPWTVYPTQICANDPSTSRGACNGDSGGPLTFNGVLTGIVSWSVKNLGCGNPRWPSVYTRVSEYVEWIHDNAK